MTGTTTTTTNMTGTTTATTTTTNMTGTTTATITTITGLSQVDLDRLSSGLVTDAVS